MIFSSYLLSLLLLVLTQNGLFKNNNKVRGEWNTVHKFLKENRCISNKINFQKESKITFQEESQNYFLRRK